MPGHPEIETALVELYRTVGDRRLLDLAADLVSRRGHGSLSWHDFGPSYFQDDVPFEQATSVRGHAVRALYLLGGATDLYTETGRPELLTSVPAQWLDMTSKKTYVAGGVGSRHQDEAFGDPFELPPDRAYCETCAAIASIMWNWRLVLLTGEARYADLMERTLWLSREWSVGDEYVIEFAMRPRLVRAAEEVDGARGCVAFERGPLVYCLEGLDVPGGGGLQGVSVNTGVAPRQEAGVDVAGESTVALGLSGAVRTTVTAAWPYRHDNPRDDVRPGTPTVAPVELRAIPYYAWANRGPTDMRVWLPELGQRP